VDTFNEHKNRYETGNATRILDKIGGNMQIKTGDLVQIKVHCHTNELHKPHEIWLVLGIEPRERGQFKGFIRIQNIHNGYTCQYIEGMLMKIETDKK
jgi:hypothetical protein